jgi:hypothetical protein
MMDLLLLGKVNMRDNGHEGRVVCGCFCGDNILQRFLPFLALHFTLTSCY